MAIKHIVFAGAEVQQIWTLASARATLREVWRVAGALREEIRFAHNRVDKAPEWPRENDNYHVTPQLLLTAALEVAGHMGTVDAAEHVRLGPVPFGYRPMVRGEEGVLMQRDTGDGLSYALQWEVPDGEGAGVGFFAGSTRGSVER